MCFRAIQKSNCFHKRGHEAPCEVSHKPYMIGMGLFEIVVSQIPDIGEMWGLSVIASFGYASIGAALAFSTVISGNKILIIANDLNLEIISLALFFYLNLPLKQGMERGPV